MLWKCNISYIDIQMNESRCVRWSIRIAPWSIFVNVWMDMNSIWTNIEFYWNVQTFHSGPWGPITAHASVRSHPNFQGLVIELSVFFPSFSLKQRNQNTLFNYQNCTLFKEQSSWESMMKRANYITISCLRKKLKVMFWDFIKLNLIASRYHSLIAIQFMEMKCTQFNIIHVKLNVWPNC